MKQLLIASVICVVVVLICQPVIGYLFEFGISAGVFAAKNKPDLATGAKFIAYGLGGIAFYLSFRK